MQLILEGDKLYKAHFNYILPIANTIIFTALIGKTTKSFSILLPASSNLKVRLDNLPIVKTMRTMTFVNDYKP